MTATPKPTYEELLTEVTSLKAELAQLRRFIFGQKRERFVPIANAQQLPIALDDERSEVTAVATATLTYIRRQKKSSPIKLPSRHLLPAHLRREDIRLEPESDVRRSKKSAMRSPKNWNINRANCMSSVMFVRNMRGRMARASSSRACRRAQLIKASPGRGC